MLQGGEVAETAVEALSEEELARVSLGEGRWVLLEPAPGPLTDSLARRVQHLRRARPPQPDRPPRAPPIRRHVRAHGAAWSAMGALVQATADFFLREGGIGRGMRALAEAGLVHVPQQRRPFLAGGRPVRLAAAFERAASTSSGSRPHVEWMAETLPRAIVEGEELDVPFTVAL